MATNSLPPDSPSDIAGALSQAIAEMAASQRRMVALMRGLRAFAAPLDGQVGMFGPHTSTRDVCDCEICGSYVPADQMDGFAARHGAVCHVNCLSAEIEARR